MKTLVSIFLLLPFTSLAGVVGISTHPLSDRARVLSAEMAGYMSQRHEMAMGLRYTQEVQEDQLLDFSAAGGQESRSFYGGGGMDFTLLKEDISQPRVSMKPFVQFMKFDGTSSSLLGAAPSLRKGFAANGVEFFPYVAIPTGIMVDNSSNEFVYYASLTLGASMPFPGAQNDKLLLSFEGNKNMGASSDYLGCLVSWIWN